MEGGLSWYFAYGSNMSALRLFGERLRPEGVGAGERIAGRLDGWRLAFNKQGRVPGTGAGNIVLAPGEVVHGTLNLLPAKGFEILDRYEGVVGGHYERRIVPVVRGDTGEVLEAVTYVALLVAEGLRPTRDYLGHLLAGHDLLPADYFRRLSETLTLD
jgi:hypothetical protein